ncbi:hypothetical protein ACH42_14065 [Endozoicomonas sp. (ex Bugula neritina AB1)]|nr:hypothetical protein ACH42_14065 [Endozoicomonas sp. (ex Bugula neritina AB1)]
MPNIVFMREYLEHIGVDTHQFFDEETIKSEYLRKIYRLDPRNKIINGDGKAVGKASNPMHLVVR